MDLAYLDTNPKGALILGMLQVIWTDRHTVDPDEPIVFGTWLEEHKQLTRGEPAVNIYHEKPHPEEEGRLVAYNVKILEHIIDKNPMDTDSEKGKKERLVWFEVMFFYNIVEREGEEPTPAKLRGRREYRPDEMPKSVRHILEFFRSGNIRHILMEESTAL